MAPHVLFLAHGMGSYDDGWSVETGELLRELYGTYQAPCFLPPFDSAIEIRGLRYDDVFSELRLQWATNSAAVIAAVEGEHGDSKAVGHLRSFNSQAAKDDFARTHLLDVVLYRFLGAVASMVRAKVENAILEALAALPPTSTHGWSILGHSLGSAVVHDTLHEMFTNPIAVGAAAPPRARLVAMIANVSRLLQSDIDAYRSATHPSADVTRGCCDFFLNAKHDWDPFCHPREFRPLDDWPDALTRSQGRYLPVAINAFAEKDIHSLEHYLRHPKVHVPLFRVLTNTGSELITDQVFRDAVTVYEMKTPFGAFEALQKKIKKVVAGESADWAAILRSFRDFLKIVDKF
jgi:hypothetical protein